MKFPPSLDSLTFSFLTAGTLVTNSWGLLQGLPQLCLSLGHFHSSAWEVYWVCVQGNAGPPHQGAPPGAAIPEQ